MPTYLGDWPVPVNDLAERYQMDAAHWNYAVEKAVQKRGNGRKLAEAIEHYGYNDPRIVALVIACVGEKRCGICGTSFVAFSQQKYCRDHYHYFAHGYGKLRA